MTNLIIGILVGVASALVLLWMWRVAERLRNDVEGVEDDQPESNVSQRLNGEGRLSK